MDIAENTPYALKLDQMTDGGVVIRQIIVNAEDVQCIIIPAVYVREVALYIASCVKQLAP